jgi:glycosyltransferase involved in cell wall biosynthesis
MTRTDQPLVSVIALCYNHERFILQCLESIRAQTYRNVEIFVTDDCSTDSSPALIRRWIDQHPSLGARFFHNQQNSGICRSVNNALALATGKYISMIATDDIWEPTKIEMQVDLMEGMPETVGVIYSDADKIDEAGMLLPQRFIETYRSFDRAPQGDIHECLWNGNFIPGMTTLIRRSVYDTVGLYDESLCYEDWDMWLRISKDFQFAYHEGPTARYRVFERSLSKAAVDKMNLANERMFTKFLLQRAVPKSVRNKAFNYAVRRIFRERENDFEGGLHTLNELIQRYRSPRLLYARLLYRAGGRYKYYESLLRMAKRIGRVLPS